MGKEITVTFTVPGQPRGKQRPRLARGGNTYTPRETVAYEKEVRGEYLQRLAKLQEDDPDREMFTRWYTGPVAVTITAYYDIPKSVSKKVRHEIEAGRQLPLKKPDTDNIAKIIIDALNGVAYKDDKQVVILEVEKAYGLPDMPHVEVTLTEWEA